MGTVNKIVSIAILVLTIGAAVMAFLLSKKRETLVNGWEKMAACINSTASDLDNGSETKFAQKLQKTNLAHTNSANLETLLPELPKQAKAVIAQRDAMALAMKDIATALELEANIEADSLKSVANYTEGKKQIVAKAQESQVRNNKIMQGIVASCGRVGVTTSVAELKDSQKCMAPIMKFNTQVTKIMTRVKSYENHISQIASAVGASSPSLSGDDFETSLKDTVNAAQSLMSSFEQTKKDLANEKDRTKTAEVKLEEREQKIVSLEKDINKQVATISDLNNKIKQLSGESDSSKQGITILEDGDPRLLKYLKGKVVEMNDKWDFVVIDLGKQSKVKQVVGKKEIDNVVMLPPNGEMVVARELGTDNQFVGKIKITKVYDNCAIANILPSPKGQSAVKVGDTVFFSEDAIDSLLKTKEVKKADDAAAAPAAAPAKEEKEEKEDKEESSSDEATE